MAVIDGVIIADNERQPCDVYTRIMGYFRPISDANIGKRQEFKDRVYFTEEVAQESEIYKSFDKQQKVA